MMNYEEIGKRLKEERRVRGYSQERVVAEMHLGEGNVALSRIENAKKGSGITNLDKLSAYAEFYDISMKYLLFGEDNSQEVEVNKNNMGKGYVIPLDKYSDEFPSVVEVLGLSAEEKDIYDNQLFQHKNNRPLSGKAKKLLEKINKQLKAFERTPDTDEFPGMDFGRGAISAEHVRAMLEEIGYGEEWLMELKEEEEEFGPIQVPNMDDSIEDRWRNCRYSGMYVNEHRTVYGYAVYCLVPYYTSEQGCVEMPVDLRGDFVEMYRCHILMYNGDGEIIGRMHGIKMEARRLWDYGNQEYAVELEAEDDLLPWQYILIQNKKIPKSYLELGNKEIVYRKFLEDLMTTDQRYSSIFLSEAVAVKENYRRRGVFTTMREILHCENNIFAECYAWKKPSEAEDKLLQYQNIINYKVAKNQNMDVLVCQYAADYAIAIS